MIERTLKKMNKTNKQLTKRIIIGKPKHNAVGVLIKPKNKFRLIVQQRPNTRGGFEAIRSIMVYDFTGKQTVDSLKKKLEKVFK